METETLTEENIRGGMIEKVVKELPRDKLEGHAKNYILSIYDEIDGLIARIRNFDLSNFNKDVARYMKNNYKRYELILGELNLSPTKSQKEDYKRALGKKS